jgi:hypothetical protein
LPAPTARWATTRTRSATPPRRAALAGPDDAYNLACLEAITGDVEAAFGQLRRAAKLGKLNSAWAWKDPDLEPLREDPRFHEIVGPRSNRCRNRFVSTFQSRRLIRASWST